MDVRNPKLTRRDMLRVLGMGAAATYLAGCGGPAVAPTAAPAAPASTSQPVAPAATAASATTPAPKVSPAAPSASQPITVSFLTSGIKEEFEMFDVFFDAFEKKTPGIKIKRNYDPSLNWTKILNMYRTEQAGDWVRSDDDSAYMMACTGLYYTLDDYVAKDLKRDDYLPFAWEKRNGPGGEISNCHIGQGGTVGFFNMDLLNKKGVKKPENYTDKNWSMEEMEAAVAELTDKKGDRVDAYGFAAPGWATAPGAYGWGNEPYFKDDPKTGRVVADFATPGRIEWYTRFIRDWVTKGYKVPPGQTEKELFAAGKLAIRYDKPEYGRAIPKNINWDVGPTWRGKTPQMTSRIDPGRCFTIPTYTKLKDAAWEVGKWAFSEEGQTILASYGWLVPPAHKKVAQSEAFLNAYKDAPGWRKVAQSIPDTLPGPWPRNPASEVFMLHLRRYDTLQLGQIPVKDYLEAEGNKVCQRILDMLEWSNDKDRKGWRFPGLLDALATENAKDATATAQAGAKK